jgi:molecular chaperone IbpA
MWMRDFDFTPLMRSVIGFDRMKDLIESALEGAPVTQYPPYNIEKTGENAWRVTMAVAGFSPSELSVVQEHNELVVTGAKQGDDKAEYLYRGMGTRSFERRLELADFVDVKEARLADGLLVVDLVREVPEEMRPRRIEIASGKPKAITGASQPPLEKKAA